MGNWKGNNGVLRVINACCGVALIAIVIYMAAAPIARWIADPERGLADYSLNRDRSIDVVLERSYPVGFTYPLPGVLLRVWLDRLAGPSAVILWGVWSAGATLAVFALIQRMIGLKRAPHRHVIAILGLLTVNYYVAWDLDALNCNMMYLALACGFLWMLDRRPATAGGLLAASIAVKLYSIAFLPYLLWRGKWRCLAATTVASLFLFVILPIPMFGLRDAWSINADWFHEVLATSAPRFPLDFQAYVIAPQKLFHLVLTSTSLPNSRGWLQLNFDQAQALARLVKFGWLALVLGYLLCGEVLRRGEPAKGEIFFMDGAVLLLVTLPISPLLQPHHCVVTLLPTMIFWKCVFDSTADRWLRVFLGGIAISGFLLLEFGPGGELRGIGTSLHFLLVLLGAYAWAWSLQRRPQGHARIEKRSLQPRCLAA